MRRFKFYRYLQRIIFPIKLNSQKSSSSSGTSILYNNNNNNNNYNNKSQHFSFKSRGKRKSPSIKKSLIFGILIFGLYFFFIGLVSFLALSSNSTSGDGSGRRRTIKTISFGNNKNQTFLDSYSSYIQLSKLGLAPLRSQSNLLSDILRSQGLFKCIPGGVHFRKLSKDKKGSFSTPPQPPVGLVSFPGSGNTWLRYLIQSSTGIYTGSVYKDFALLRNGFPGESITDSRVLVVKTHEYGPKARQGFKKIILLLRKPREAILAEFNRLSAGHVGVARKEMYYVNNGDNWSYFVDQKGKDWRETYLDWINHFTGDLFLTLYSSLVQNTLAELKSMLKFLEIPVSSSTLRCVMKHKDGIYKRRHTITTKGSPEFLNGSKGSNTGNNTTGPHNSQQPFNPFTPEMDKYLWAQEQIVIQAIRNRTRHTDTTTNNFQNPMLMLNNQKSYQQLKFL